MADENPENDPLQSLIAEILDAEAQGEIINREEFLRQHSEHEASLREFFANHDSMRSGGAEEATLPPGTSRAEDATFALGTSRAEDATLPPTYEAGKDGTLPPSGNQVSSEAKVGDKVRYFGDYELLEEIARGGMGVVYKARQVNLNRIVALKMILSGQLASDEDVKRFYTEAEAAANLDHTGIVPIFEVGQHQGQHYFSMGFIEGQSLAQKVADGPLPPREAAELVKKICEAMAYAHDRGVIHRDLKPANILIDQNGQPKVTDFGLAKQMNVDSGLTGTGQILGTPSYMAPEQASGKVNEIGPLADVYALGAILYCLLTGRPPFQASNPMDTLLQVLETDPPRPNQTGIRIPHDLEAVCMKCLEKNPSTRYSSCHNLAQDLQRFSAGERTQARPSRIKSAAYINWFSASLVAGLIWGTAETLVTQWAGFESRFANVVWHAGFVVLFIAGGAIGWNSIVLPLFVLNRSTNPLAKVAFGLCMMLMSISLWVLYPIVAVYLINGSEGNQLSLHVKPLLLLTSIASLLGTVGPIFCMSIPAKSGTQGVLITSVVMQVAGLMVSLNEKLEPLLMGHREDVAFPLQIGSFVVFVWFLKKLALHIGEQDLIQSALSLLIVVRRVVLFIIAPIATIKLIGLLSASNSGLNASYLSDAKALLVMPVMLALTVGGAIGLLKYVSLIARLQSAMLNRL